MQQNLHELSSKIQRLRGVKTVFATAGGGGQSNVGSLSVQWMSAGREASIVRVENESARYASDIPNLRANTVTANPLTPGNGLPVAVRVLGPKLSEVHKLSAVITRKMTQLPTLKEVTNNTPVALPELQVTVSHRKAQQLGVSIKNVIDTIQTETQGLSVSTYQPGSSSTASRIILQTKGATPVPWAPP